MSDEELLASIAARRRRSMEELQGSVEGDSGWGTGREAILISPEHPLGGVRLSSTPVTIGN